MCVLQIGANISTLLVFFPQTNGWVFSVAVVAVTLPVRPRVIRLNASVTENTCLNILYRRSSLKILN